MPQVKDPVCGMMVDSDKAAGKSSYQGQTYYFCGEGCKRAFDGNPATFVKAAAGTPAAGATKGPTSGMGGKKPGAPKPPGTAKPKM